MTENIVVFGSEHIQDFMNYILMDIAWIDQETKYNAKYVSLMNYHSYRIIDRLKKRRCGYFIKHNLETLTLL